MLVWFPGPHLDGPLLVSMTLSLLPKIDEKRVSVIGLTRAWGPWRWATSVSSNFAQMRLKWRDSTRGNESCACACACVLRARANRKVRTGICHFMNFLLCFLFYQYSLLNLYYCQYYHSHCSLPPLLSLLPSISYNAVAFNPVNLRELHSIVENWINSKIEFSYLCFPWASVVKFVFLLSYFCTSVDNEMCRTLPFSWCKGPIFFLF